MDTLFLNGLVINGLGGIQERGGVLVQGDRIAAVGAGLESRRGPDTRVVDLEGRALLPGFIDTHVHIGGGDFRPGWMEDTLGMAAHRGAEAVRRDLMAGITTLRTPGTREFLDVDLRDAINEGLIPGPRIIAAGRGITTTGGHLHDTCIEADGVDAVMSAIRYHVKRRVDAIKLMLSSGAATLVGNINVPQYNLDEARAVVHEAHKHGLKVFTHTHGTEAIQIGIEAGVDSIDHGHGLTEEQAVRMREKGIPLVPTFGPGYYYVMVRRANPERIARMEKMRPVRIASFKLALEVGVPIGMASDCGAYSGFPNGENLLEMELMVEYGMKPEEVLKTATSVNARYLGLDHLIGSLEPGKLADLVVLEGNPIDDIGLCRRGVKLVMRSGVVYRDDLPRT